MMMRYPLEEGHIYVALKRLVRIKNCSLYDAADGEAEAMIDMREFYWHQQFFATHKEKCTFCALLYMRIRMDSHYDEAI